MVNKKDIYYPPLFSSGNYYSKEDFLFPITAINQRVTNTTVLKNNNGITLIYVYDGSGTIIVNSIEYPLQKGALICLGSYHYFQLKPHEGPIELAQCQLSYDAFLYMAANPYYGFSEINLKINPLTSLLEEDMIERIEIIIGELIDITNKRSEKNRSNTRKNINQRSPMNSNFIHKSGNTEFYLGMRLMGILQKNLPESILI